MERSLLPGVKADFRMNVLAYRPGAALPQVEIHVMEHGLLMLSGGGIYLYHQDGTLRIERTTISDHLIKGSGAGIAL